MMQQLSEVNDVTQVVRVSTVEVATRLNVEAASIDVMHGIGWRPPDKSILKLKCDGAWCSKSNTRGLGWVGWCVDGLKYSRWQIALVIFIVCLPPLLRRKQCIHDLQGKSFEMVAVETNAKVVMDQSQP
ncbi:hypothetical protein ACFX2I_029401 [Malus domestica]